ncbi:MAG TPA: intermembrane transport protein PqiB [Desulfobacterales bacterium]
MTNDKSLLESQEIPEAVVEGRRRRISIIWVVPLVAVLIGAWLVYKTISEKGPQITIRFESASGLEAGETKIKHKDVDLGLVEKIELAEDLSHVIVTANLVKQAEAFLSENTRFWVVRARVDVSGVSGLGTLFSGVYIAMEPGKSGAKSRQFIGLEQPPPVSTESPGSYFVLESERKGSIEIGSPVYYRQMKAGQVTDFQLSEDGRNFNIRVFVHAPFDRFVYRNTRFWESSGLEMSLDPKGVSLNTESLVTLLIGGIVFDVTRNQAPDISAPAETLFFLYPNRRTAEETLYTVKRRLLLIFDESVAGLQPGAAVEIRGIPVGQVLDVKLEFDLEQMNIRIPVLIEIYPEQIDPAYAELVSAAEQRQRLDQLVAKGLRAQLKTSSLLTGKQVVSLDMFPNAAPAKVRWDGPEPYPVVPTVATPIEEIGTKIAGIVAKVEKLPIEQIGRDLQAVIHNTRQLTAAPELKEAIVNLNVTLQETSALMAELRAVVSPQMSATLDQARISLAAAETALHPDAALQANLNEALLQLSMAARALRALVDTLERNPESLVRGRPTMR